MPKTTTRPSILDIDQCKPGCNAANKEICKEFSGKFKCDCRSGYTKKAGSNTCHGKKGKPLVYSIDVLIRDMSLQNCKILSSWFE